MNFTAESRGLVFITSHTSRSSTSVYPWNQGVPEGDDALIVADSASRRSINPGEVGFIGFADDLEQTLHGRPEDGVVFTVCKHLAACKLSQQIGGTLHVVQFQAS